MRFVPTSETLTNPLTKGVVGYDSGIIGGVLTLSSYQHDYRYSEDEATRVASLAVGLQQLGAFLACFAIWPVTHRFGRKYAIIVCSMIFVVGAVVQTINTHSTNAFYLGRIIAGIGTLGSHPIKVDLLMLMPYVRSRRKLSRRTDVLFRDDTQRDSRASWEFLPAFLHVWYIHELLVS